MTATTMTMTAIIPLTATMTATPTMSGGRDEGSPPASPQRQHQEENQTKNAPVISIQQNTMAEKYMMRKNEK